MKKIKSVVALMLVFCLLGLITEFNNNYSSTCKRDPKTTAGFCKQTSEAMKEEQVRATAGFSKQTSDALKSSVEEIKVGKLSIQKNEVEIVAQAPGTITTKDELIVSEIKEVPYYQSYDGFKSLENYQLITSYKPGALQRIAMTNEKGFRTYDNRYLVALGSYFTKSIGQYFDLVLENGTVIPCILGDAKDDTHTDINNHSHTVVSSDCSEFIVDLNQIPANVLSTGDASTLYDPEWNSPVVKIVFYDKYVEL